MHPLADSGRVIAGRYRLEAPIGRGAMGVVWRARDQLLDRDVALKEVQIAETLTDDERANAYQRTLREAKTAARLNHPGVVTVYDVAEDGGAPWIVMQLVSALSLDQVLATSGPLPPRRAAEVGRQLLSALSVAHAAGVMHRDVKPSNVLLGQDDRAVLTDFGIATFQGDPRLTQTGMVMGSPGFTAPERIRGEDASPASDLWSLGATLYAAVEGHGPFEKRGGAITTMSAIINEDAPAAPRAGAFGQVIAALLRREPSDRPDAATAARMITDLMPLLPAQGGSSGYVPTSLSSLSSRGAVAPDRSAPGGSAPDRSAADRSAADWSAADRSAPPDQTMSEDPFGSATPGAITPGGGQPALGSTSATRPQPVLEAGASAPSGYSPPSSPSPSSSRPALPPADFSSWYDQSPRSGAAAPWSGGAYPPAGAAGPGAGAASSSGAGSRYGAASQSDAASWSGAASASAGPGRSGAAAPPGSWPDYQPGTPPRRRSGLWWKIGLVVLAVLGAAAGAATIVLLNNHHTPGSPANGSSSSAGTTTLPPASTAPQIVNAVNAPSAALPSGWTTFTHQAAGGETAGFKIGYPASWMPSTSGNQTYLRDPSANVNMLIDLTPHTYPNDMLREAEFIKQQSLDQNRFPGYTQLGLASTAVRGTRGAYWKFTWVNNGTSQEAIDLLFVLQTKTGPQSYALYMTAPTSAWNQWRPTFDAEVETFAPLT
jgi:serine/threonine protein kinase